MWMQRRQKEIRSHPCTDRESCLALYDYSCNIVSVFSKSMSHPHGLFCLLNSISYFFFFKFITRTFSCQIISFYNWIQNKQSLIWNELTELWEDQQHCFSPAFKLGGFLRFAFKHNENRLSWHWSANYKLAPLSGCLNVTAETNCLLA